MSDERRDGKTPAPGEVAEGEAERENFLSRWSRLKQTSRQGGTPAVADTPEPAAEDVQNADTAEAVGEADAEEPPGDEDMPPLESLGPDSDYSPFMSPRVSAELRRRALRQMFRSPKFNITDGLEVYAEDYTKFAPLGNVMTADLKFRLERQLKEKLAEATEPDGETGDEAETLRSAAVDKDRDGSPQDAPAPRQNMNSPEDDDDRSDA